MASIEGKAARVAARGRGRERVSNAREHMSQSAGSERISIEGRKMEGETARVAATECGQRRSFKIGCCNFWKELFLKARRHRVDRNEKNLYDQQSKKNE